MARATEAVGLVHYNLVDLSTQSLEPLQIMPAFDVTRRNRMCVSPRRTEAKTSSRLWTDMNPKWI